MSLAIDTGIYGAKRQSFKKASPRSLLLQLLDDHPGSTEDVLCKLFIDAVAEDRDQVEAIATHWFTNEYRTAVRDRTEPQERRSVRSRVTAERANHTKQIIKSRATRMVLLDMTMPNGKSLRDCTGKDCAKAGGWLAKIAKAIKPTDVVGKVMSETQVRKFFK